MTKILFCFCIFFLMAFSLSGQLASNEIEITPNPFVNKTIVNYTIAASDTVTIYIYNRWGQGIITLRYHYPVQPGIYHDTLNMENFPDGVYLLTFTDKYPGLNTRQIVKSVSTAIRKFEKDSALKIYPNPVADRLNLDFESPHATARDLIFYNSLDQIVHTIKNTNQRLEIDISFLSPGTYYLKIQSKSDTKESVVKFLKE